MATNNHHMQILGALAATAALASSWPVAAHPHVFAKVRTELIAKDGALVALRHTWIFDKIWLENQLLEHDKDNDGKLTREELGPLEAESRQTLDMFRSFTVVRSGGALIRVANPRDVVVDYVGEVLGLSFTASLAKPVSLTGPEVLLETYDATFFSSFTWDGPDAVKLVGAAPAGCSIQVGVPASPQQMNAYRMIKKQMGPEWVDTGGLPKSTSISCPKSAPQSSGEPMAIHQPAAMR